LFLRKLRHPSRKFRIYSAHAIWLDREVSAGEGSRIHQLQDCSIDTIAATVSPEIGKYFLPVQMPFHRARLRGFEVLSMSDARARIGRAA
jgi:hypothetical protein